MKNLLNISLGVFFPRCFGWSCFECLSKLFMISYHFRFFIVSWVKSNYGLLYFVLCAAFGFTLLINDGLFVFHQLNSLPNRASTGAPPKREDELVRNRDYYPISCPRPSPAKSVESAVTADARDWRPRALFGRKLWCKRFVRRSLQI